MAISEEDLFYLSQKANAPYFEDAYFLYANCIKKALENIKIEYPQFEEDSVKLYIQGTYENDTMVDDFSKLEIVVEFPQNCFGELDNKAVLKTKTIIFNETLIKQRVVKFKPIIPIPYIKRTILETLIDETRNGEIFNNNKSITIPPSRKINISCEILPCYTLNEDPNNHAVIIWDSLINKYVAAFPVLHCKNLKIKDKNTSEKFLKIVRIFRNVRDILIQNEIINEGYAPSYFIECLLYNVPDELYKGKLNSIMLKILNYFKNCNLNKFVCAHEQFKMFGNNSDAWTVFKARIFIELMVEIWKEYDYDKQ